MKQKVVILAEKKLGPLTSKMANGVIRFAGNKVLAVIDSSKAGKDVSEVLGFGEGIPVLSSLEESLGLQPNTLLIGISPPGGQFPPDWYSIIIKALQNKIHIVSGLHEFLSDIPEFELLAKRYNVTITDLRKYDGALLLAKGQTKNLKSKTILTVGTHGNSGKMTTTIIMVEHLHKMGISAGWIATGQIGIFLKGGGVPLDALKGDFLSGILENALVKNDGKYEYLFVEGQGSLLHLGYSPVSLALLHGVLPDAMIMCHRHDVGVNDYGVDTGNIKDAIELNEKMVSFVKPSRVVGVAVNTYNLLPDRAHRLIEEISNHTGLPVTDPVRFGAEPLNEALLNYFKNLSSG